MATTTERVRRYSRSSFARMRLLPTLPRAAPRRRSGRGRRPRATGATHRSTARRRRRGRASGPPPAPRRAGRTHGEDVFGGRSARQPSTAGSPANSLSGAASGARVLTVSVLVNSRSRSSSGRPIVRSVVLRMATRSHRRSASSRRCVVRKIVTPLRPSPAISSWTSRLAIGSRPAVGSSRNSTCGSLLRAAPSA